MEVHFSQAVFSCRRSPACPAEMRRQEPIESGEFEFYLLRSILPRSRLRRLFVHWQPELRSLALPCSTGGKKVYPTIQVCAELLLHISSDHGRGGSAIASQQMNALIIVLEWSWHSNLTLNVQPHHEVVHPVRPDRNVFLTNDFEADLFVEMARRIVAVYI